MRLERRGPVGGLVLDGTPEEWARFARRLEGMYAELKQDVLPAAKPDSGGVVVNLSEALVMMGVMEDEDLTRSGLVLIMDQAERLRVVDESRRRWGLPPFDGSPERRGRATADEGIEDPD